MSNNKISDILVELMELENPLYAIKIKLRDIPKEIWKEDFDKMFCHLLQLKSKLDDYED